jgi:hypothetical protein
LRDAEQTHQARELKLIELAEKRETHAQSRAQALLLAARQECNDKLESQQQVHSQERQLLLDREQRAVAEFEHERDLLKSMQQKISAQLEQERGEREKIEALRIEQELKHQALQSAHEARVLSAAKRDKAAAAEICRMREQQVEKERDDALRLLQRKDVESEQHAQLIKQRFEAEKSRVVQLYEHDKQQWDEERKRCDHLTLAKRELYEANIAQTVQNSMELASKFDAREHILKERVLSEWHKAQSQHTKRHKHQDGNICVPVAALVSPSHRHATAAAAALKESKHSDGGDADNSTYLQQTREQIRTKLRNRLVASNLSLAVLDDDKLLDRALEQALRRRGAR